MRKFPLAAAVILGSLGAIAAAIASPVYEPGADRPYTFTNTTTALTATSQTITLSAPSRHIAIKSDIGSTAMYFRLDGTAATTSNFKLDPGGSLVLDPLPMISKISIISTASPTGNVSILAW